MEKVTGIGGIFFKCKNPKAMNEWYKQHLGIEAGDYGTTFDYGDGAKHNQTGQTQWTTFPETTNYFEPSKQNFMVNYTVANLEALHQELVKAGVTIIDEMETFEYGKFLHILDLEGNKVELWEPAD